MFIEQTHTRLNINYYFQIFFTTGINKKNKGFPYLCRSWSTRWHNVLPNNTNQNRSPYQQHLSPMSIEFFYPMRDSRSSTRNYLWIQNIRCFPTVKSQANNFMRICLRLVHTLDWLATVPLCLSDRKTDDIQNLNFLTHFGQLPLDMKGLLVVGSFLFLSLSNDWSFGACLLTVSFVGGMW